MISLTVPFQDGSFCIIIHPLRIYNNHRNNLIWRALIARTSLDWHLIVLNQRDQKARKIVTSHAIREAISAQPLTQIPTMHMNWWMNVRYGKGCFKEIDTERLSCPICCLPSRFLCGDPDHYRFLLTSQLWASSHSKPNYSGFPIASSALWNIP